MLPAAVFTLLKAIDIGKLFSFMFCLLLYFLASFDTTHTFAFVLKLLSSRFHAGSDLDVLRICHRYFHRYRKTIISNLMKNILFRPFSTSSTTIKRFTSRDTITTWRWVADTSWRRTSAPPDTLSRWLSVTSWAGWVFLFYGTIDKMSISWNVSINL